MTALTTPHASSPLASLKINHVAIRVPDFNVAAAWYAEQLDFRLKQIAFPLPGLPSDLFIQRETIVSISS